MAKVYYQGKSGVELLMEKNKQFKKLFELKELLSKIYLETVDGNLTGSIYQLKITESWSLVEEISLNLESIGIRESKRSDGITIDHIFQGKTLRLYKSGGRLQNVIDEEGNSLAVKTPSTAQQEDAVVWCLNNNQFDPLKISANIGFQFDKSWNASFEKTFNKITEKIDPKQYTTYRDSNSKKPKFLNEMTDESILPDKKDNWNPSDLWMVRKGYSGNDISKMVSNIKQKKNSIADLNNLLYDLFERGMLIGISLKKVEGTANFSKIEIDYNMINEMKFKRITKKNSMSVLNSYFDINLSYTIKKETDYMIRLRPRGKSGSVKVYFEGKPPTRSTWDGAVSKNLLEKNFFGSKLLEFENKVLSNVPTKTTLMDYLQQIEADELLEFMKTQNKYVTFLDETKQETNKYFLQRGAVLVYCIYLISIQDQDDFFKSSILSAMKLNDFSSIYYKVY